MDDARRHAEPRVPDGGPTGPFVTPPALEDVVPNPATLAIGPNEVDIGALFWSPATAPAAVASYAFEGEGGLSRLETLIEERANRLETGRFSKYDTYYLPQSPVPPGVWEYKCESCRFYSASNARGNVGGECDVVGQEGDWFGGDRVHPSGWCTLWLPEEGRRWFEFVKDRLEVQERP